MSNIPRKVRDKIEEHAFYDYSPTHPLKDRNGVVIKPGMRVRCRWAYYYINVTGDEGYVLSTDQYGGVYVYMDHEHDNVNRDGVIVSRSNVQYVFAESRDVAGNETYTEII
jgi:hypothetical protein